MTAATSSITSPITGETANVNVWWINPKMPALLTRPAIRDGPPATTVMNALAT